MELQTSFAQGTDNVEGGNKQVHLNTEAGVPPRFYPRHLTSK